MSAHTITSLDAPPGTPTPVSESLAEWGSGYGYGYFPGSYGVPGDGPWGSYRTATGGTTDRKDGRNLPVFWSEQDLRWYRIIARHLDSTNNFAIGFLNHLVGYHVRKGFAWQACRRGVDKTPYQTVGTPKDPLVAKGQRVLDQWRDATLWPLVSREAFRIWRREGEVFGRFFKPRWNLMPEFRLVGGELIGNPSGDTTGPDSYGVRCDPDDVSDVLAYHQFDPEYPGMEHEWVSADRMVHARCNVDRHCVKRGVTDFLPNHVELEQVRRLGRAMLDTSNAQAPIAWLERYATAVEDQVRNMVPKRPLNEPQYLNYPNPAGVNSFYPPGFGQPNGYAISRVVKTDAGRQYEPGPTFGGVPNYIAVMQACLRAACVRWGMPENFTGDASNNNFASLLVAGSPFVVMVEGVQLEWNLLWERPVALKVLDLAVDAGYLTPEERRQLDVEITEPQVTTPEPDKDATRITGLVSAGLLSKTTAQQQLGLDPQHEAANMQAEGGQEGGGGGDTGPPQDPEAGRDSGGALELLGLSEGFSGTITDALGRERHYRDGKQVAGHPDDGGEHVNDPREWAKQVAVRTGGDAPTPHDVLAAADGVAHVHLDTGVPTQRELSDALSDAPAKPKPAHLDRVEAAARAVLADKTLSPDDAAPSQRFARHVLAAVSGVRKHDDAKTAAKASKKAAPIAAKPALKQMHRAAQRAWEVGGFPPQPFADLKQAIARVPGENTLAAHLDYARSLVGPARAAAESPDVPPKLKKVARDVLGGATAALAHAPKTEAREDRSAGKVKKTGTDSKGRKYTRYVNPDAGGGTGGDPATPDHDPKMAAHAAGQLDHLPDEVKRNPGLMARLGDALLTVAAKVNLAAIRNNDRIMAAVSLAEALFDTPDDLKKFGYAPVASGGTAAADASGRMDPLRGATGLSTHLACTIASHVLGRLSVWAKKKATGAKTEAEQDGPDWAGLAEVMAGIFAAVNEALGLEGAPDKGTIEAKFREMFGGQE